METKGNIIKWPKKTVKFYEKKNPLVSIIMNCHNGEKYLQKV